MAIIVNFGGGFRCYRFPACFNDANVEIPDAVFYEIGDTYLYFGSKGIRPWDFTALLRKKELITNDRIPPVLGSC